MWLRKLYDHNKMLFLIVMAFLLSYIFINWKWGTVATPVNQYGMFSGVYKLNKPEPFVVVYDDSGKLMQQKFSHFQSDFVQVMYPKMIAQESINQTVYNTLFPFTKYFPKQNFINDANQQEILAHYLIKLKSINSAIDSIGQKTIIYNNGKIVEQ